MSGDDHIAPTGLTDYQAKYFAHELTKRCPPDSVEKLAGALVDAQVDLNPHQVDAALFAFRSPLSKGAILADEVGLGKTIEAGLVISQRWAERKRRILVITPSNLRKQWYQELTEKFFVPCRIIEAKSFQLFEGVFGASDEVLGAIESGLDFEKRIAGIYQRCRKPEEIQSAFDQLQLDLGLQINESMTRTRQQLLENFDDEVREKLKVRDQDSKAYLNRFERLLMQLTRHELGEHAELIGDSSFRLKSRPFPEAPPGIPLGLYELPRRSGEAYLYRLNHPLACAVVARAKARELPEAELQFAYREHAGKVSLLEPLIGKSGWLSLCLFSVEALDQAEDHWIFAGATEDGRYLEEDALARLLTLPARVVERPTQPAVETVGRIRWNDVTPAKAGVHSQMESGNAGFPALDPGFRDCRFTPSHTQFVMPAKAGIHSFIGFLDPRFRGGDVLFDFSDSLFRRDDEQSETRFRSESTVSATAMLGSRIDERQQAIQRGISERNGRFFEAEADKLDGWADDLKLGLEREIKELDRQVKEARRTATTALALEDKLAGQKRIRGLEAQRNDKRRSLFDAQDAVDKQRQELIAKIEGKLLQHASLAKLFSIRWHLA